jgi:hypothetical protein
MGRRLQRISNGVVVRIAKIIWHVEDEIGENEQEDQNSEPILESGVRREVHNFGFRLSAATLAPSTAFLAATLWSCGDLDTFHGLYRCPRIRRVPRNFHICLRGMPVAIDDARSSHELEMMACFLRRRWAA